MSSSKRRDQEEGVYNNLIYPGTHVLRNKLGIFHQEALDKAEADMVSLREPTRPHFKTFALSEMASVHKHLLSPLYEWAGQIRTYTTGRGSASFARPEHIASYFESSVLKPLQRLAFLRRTTPESFAERSAHFASEINAVHPFIDGNGRITRLFLKDLALQAGYQLDIRPLEAQKGAWYEAMKEGFETGKTEKLQTLILTALTPIKIIPDDYKPSANAIAATERFRRQGLGDEAVRHIMYGIDLSNEAAAKIGGPTFQARTLAQATKAELSEAPQTKTEEPSRKR